MANRLSQTCAKIQCNITAIGVEFIRRHFSISASVYKKLNIILTVKLTTFLIS